MNYPFPPPPPFNTPAFIVHCQHSVVYGHFSNPRSVQFLSDNIAPEVLRSLLAVDGDDNSNGEW